MTALGEELLATLAMRRTAENYAFAVDQVDGERFAAQFTEDGVLVAPLGNIVGRKALSEVPRRVAERYARTWHAVFNLVPVIKGDTARAETYGIARHFMRDSSGSPICYEMTIRYADTFVRTNDGLWLLAERRLQLDATHKFPVEGRHLMPREGQADEQ